MRIVLNWGAKPKDLDSYLNVPAADPSHRDCLIFWKNKKCNKGSLSEVKLGMSHDAFHPHTAAHMCMPVCPQATCLPPSPPCLLPSRPYTLRRWNQLHMVEMRPREEIQNMGWEEQFTVADVCAWWCDRP